MPRHTRLATRPLAILCVLLVSAPLLTGCCVRWAMDGPDRTFSPTAAPETFFVLSLFPYENFDAASDSTGLTRLTRSASNLALVPQNFTCSFIFESAPGSTIDITTSNGETATGVVGDDGELKVLAKSMPAVTS